MKFEKIFKIFLRANVKVPNGDEIKSKETNKRKKRLKGMEWLKAKDASPAFSSSSSFLS